MAKKPKRVFLRSRDKEVLKAAVSYYLTCCEGSKGCERSKAGWYAREAAYNKFKRAVKMMLKVKRGR